MTELPKGWAVASFSQIGTWMGGGTPSKAVGSFWGGPIPWISPKDMKTKIIRSTIDGITADAVDNSAAKLIPTGSVVIVARSGILAHTLPVAITAIESTLNQDMKALALSKGIESEFVAWGLRAFEQAILSKCRKGGTTVHSIEMPSLVAFELPIPPTNEQRRIVAKIEAMFERIDKGVESLAAAKTTLGLYRQSLLKSAFEGRLTAAWRSQNPDKLEPQKALLARIQKERETRYKSALDDWQTALSEWRAGGEVGRKPGKPSRPPELIGEAVFPSGEVAQIPSAWRWSPMSDVGRTSGGLTKNQKREALPLKAKYLRVANVYSNELRLDHITEIGLTEEELSKSRLEKGDLLFVEGNGSLDQIGRVAVWDGSIPDMTHQNHLIRFSPDGLLDSQFAMLFMISPVGRDLIKAQASSTSGLHTLSISKIANLPVPICSPAEQAEITRILDARLSAADAMEAEINAALLRAEALRQSILKQAFAGILVPQDPTDEPALTLLARIKAERVKSGKTKPRKAVHAG
jgi:type I restriction enzyme, S subunit